MFTPAPARCYEPDFTPVESTPIGHGNFSSVELARPTAAAAAGADRHITGYVAVKCCSTSNAERMRILRQEWSVFSALNDGFGYKAGPLCLTSAHPCIIGCYGYYENNDEAAIVLEHAAYGDLMSYVRQHHGTASAQPPSKIFGEHDLREVTRQVLTALAITHAAGFVHRDVKPHNILVVQRSPLQVKLADFGLAKKVGQSNLWGRQNSAGDYDFMPPDVRERTREGAVLKRKDYFKIDTYAVGVTLYYLLAGSLPQMPDFIQLNMVDARRERWPHVTDDCLSCLAGLLSQVDDERPLCQEALAHPWFTAHLNDEQHIPGHLIHGGETHALSNMSPSITHSDLLESDFETAAHMAQKQGQHDSSDDGDTVRSV
jgi:serine/threonine protein kinase